MVHTRLYKEKIYPKLNEIYSHLIFHKMNSEEIRKKFEKKVSDIPYPSEPILSRDPQYMSYSFTEEQKKNQEFGDYISQKSFYPYESYDTTEIKNEIQQTNICPRCDEKSEYSCNCTLHDMMCKNGHFWYVSKTGHIILEDPHQVDLTFKTHPKTLPYFKNS